MGVLNLNWNAFTICCALVLIPLLIYSVIKLRSNRALAEKLCFYLLMFLLIYKTSHYVIYCVVLAHPWNQQIPCEISQISYFLCPLAYLSQQKYVKQAGAFVGMLAGFIQLVAIVVSPMSFVNSENLTFISFIETIIMHYLVLWTGLVQVTCIFKLEIKKIWQVYLVFLGVVLWGVLASYTWRFGTDAGFPNEPANIGFVQRCVLPSGITDKVPWLLEGHNFIIPYLIAFFIFTAAVYIISNLSFKTLKPQEESFYGMGWIKMRKFLNSHNIANN